MAVHAFMTSMASMLPSAAASSNADCASYPTPTLADCFELRLTGSFGHHTT